MTREQAKNISWWTDGDYPYETDVCKKYDMDARINEIFNYFEAQLKEAQKLTKDMSNQMMVLEIEHERLLKEHSIQQLKEKQ